MPIQRRTLTVVKKLGRGKTGKASIFDVRLHIIHAGASTRAPNALPTLVKNIESALTVVQRKISEVAPRWTGSMADSWLDPSIGRISVDNISRQVSVPRGASVSKATKGKMQSLRGGALYSYARARGFLKEDFRILVGLDWPVSATDRFKAMVMDIGTRNDKTREHITLDPGTYFTKTYSNRLLEWVKQKLCPGELPINQRRIFRKVLRNIKARGIPSNPDRADQRGYVARAVSDPESKSALKQATKGYLKATVSTQLWKNVFEQEMIFSRNKPPKIAGKGRLF